MTIPWYLNMYFNTPVPMWAMGSIALATVGGLIWSWRYRWVISLVAYCSVIICHTLVFREPSAEARCIMTPFWNYKLFSGNELEDFGEIVMNVVLYVPVGAMFGMEMVKKCIEKYRIVLITLSFGFSFSLTTELLQFIFRRGLCETDDVIHNVFGCMTGFWVVEMITRIFRFLRPLNVNLKIIF